MTANYRRLSTIGHLLTMIGALLVLIAPQLPGQAPLKLAREGIEFKIFQFPKDAMPRIDGKTDDWEMVPPEYTYDTHWLKDTEDGQQIDTSDLAVRVTVGWVKDLNRLYFLYEAYDDYWDFGRYNPAGYLNDIFEVVVDADLSGGPLIYNPVYPSDDMKWDGKTKAYLDNHFTFSGVHAQNYHIFTPPVNQAEVLVWGCQPWIASFPHANFAYDYDFAPGESGHLVLEFWITPFDYGPYEGAEYAVVSRLEENQLIGLSWSVLDFDGGARKGHFNLSHDVRMVKDASYLCAFRLMPLEPKFRPVLQADWIFSVVDMPDGRVAFRDLSVGEITRWHWDFGDGQTSDKQHPVHRYAEKGVHRVVTLEVVGPKGSSKRSRYWEVMLR